VATASLQVLPSSAKHKLVLAPATPDLKQVLPWAKEVKGRLLIPHGNAEVRILRNMGYRVEEPILTQYDWVNDTPFESQKTRAYVLSSMGCGKTRATLFAADFLMRLGEIKSALIVAPLSTLSMVWENEIFSKFYHRQVNILHGVKSFRKKRLADAADFYVINHDGVGTILEDLLAKVEIDLVIIDELASYRNASTDRHKVMRKLVEKKKYVWGLTGVPTPNAPTDAWAQCRLITPERVPKFFGQFRDRTMRQITQFKWIPREEALTIVQNAMRPSVRYTRDECIDLPPVTYANREIEMSDDQNKVYEAMFKKLKADFAEHQITAANEGVRLNKLLQICCGWVYSDNKGIVDLKPVTRLKETKELIEQADGKVIVFVPYIHAVNNVFTYLANYFSCAKVYGETSKTERDTIFNSFQKEDKPRVLVAHPLTMAHGLTLTAASTIVWFSPPQSLEVYLQANARITRPGQKQNQLIAHMIGSKIERMTYKRLEQNDKLQGILLNMLGGLNEH
jgi:SNF2 family DNA or RNA helicase